MLTNEQLDELRLQLEVDVADIDVALRDGSDDAIELDQTRVGRLSRMDAMQQQAMAAGRKERLHLKRRRLEAALARVEQGEFGLCCQCREPIPANRLIADLAAPFCAVCQGEIDDKRTSG